MDADLAALEERDRRGWPQLVRRLRDENAALLDAASAQAENAALRVKVDSAMLRLQRLLERLPEEAA